MPLKRGKSQATISENIRREVRADGMSNKLPRSLTASPAARLIRGKSRHHASPAAAVGAESATAAASSQAALDSAWSRRMDLGAM
jgi:hypothetical protein